MRRECTGCRRPFTPADLARGESRQMGHERRAAGLHGLRFLYYSCPQCGTNDIFVDVLPRPGEPPADFDARRREMEGVARGVPRGFAEVVVVPVAARALPASRRHHTAREAGTGERAAGHPRGGRALLLALLSPAGPRR